jgi:hypothetical protein
MRKPPPDASRASSVTNETEIDALPFKSEVTEGAKEILLCLRPIRDGDEKVDPKYRFVAKVSLEVSEGSKAGFSSPRSALGDPLSLSSKQGLPHSGTVSLKRKAVAGGGDQGEQKRTRTESDLVMDATVAESLMLMSSIKN